jgi:fructose-1,6-bisphosphatase I
MLKNLTKFIEEKYPEKEDLGTILSNLALAGKIISKRTNKAGIDSLRGHHGGNNIHGEDQQKLDVFANEVCKEYLYNSGVVSLITSEEEDSVVAYHDREEARYVVAFDPLDGSSNIDVNTSIGTIFSVHETRTDVAWDAEEQFFQKGSTQVLSGYILYGSSTVLVFTFGSEVHEFTLEPEVGEFFLSMESIRTPDVCTYYSVNEGNMPSVQAHDRAYVDHIKFKLGASGRYIGTLVADFHRNLIKGGVFVYPAIDKTGSGEYRGKLRLNYELKPMAWLQTVADGLATNGKCDILNIIPISLHERESIVMGSRAVVSDYEEFLKL